MHAPLAPSSAEQWAHCSGSVAAQAALPNPESEATRNGTAAHWVIEQTLCARSRSCSALIGLKAPNGVVIDEVIAEGAQMLCDDVAAVVDRFGAWLHVRVECRVDAPRIHPQNWGTPDVWLYVRDHDLLFLWDYKHGRRKVKARGNLQLANYLAGLADFHQIDGYAEQQTRVVARIVQPYCYDPEGPVREWGGRLSDFRPYWNQLHDAAERVFSTPALSTGAHCRDCRAVGICSAARQAAYNLIDVAEQPYQMDAMSGRDLAVERALLTDGLAAATSRLEAIEDELRERVTRGETDSGLTLGSAPGRLEWSIPDAQAIALAGQLGVDIGKTVALTPTQAKAAAPKAVRPMLEQILKDVTRRPAGALKLIPQSETIGARAFSVRTDNATL